ncbi:MAG: bifunctional lysylphosphatidylglycerol flippase/synthetase MprF [Finegoldia magna]|uniref:bifunctional lysylphosphatidylglycerol flippase/synthetase MprF n=1 Tax=Finegoldia magna TaxID=1260 RepID=UPI0026EDF86B|nr:bifunctional lysylphosphatidylglycerol flippase/synthetase MprF [Finegoldia magna]MDU5186022.1 bifunctional lysylphosphatidylglycerol flippase/synthetase MprF [Finegoldia magna]MDU5970085.1 bifunctional lysylphosphatidylglycerol flippase/synthetase MprF [Finegoldia magna]MDU7033505.1 bifunctional lysylphosphatidylglycerol flippase/synthetase MprF [Finegoldia magna]
MDKKLKYIRTFYTIIFTIIVLYIVRNNFILPNHIFKYKIFLSMEQKIENLVLGILVFFVSSISYFVVDEKFNIKNLKNYWALESLRKFIWINEVESVFKGADTYQNKKINKSISNFIALSLISLFTIFYIKPEWTLFLIYLFVIVIAVCVIYFKNKSLYFLEYISIEDIGFKRKILSIIYELIVTICNIMFFVFVIKQFTDVNFSNLVLIYCVSNVFGQISLMQDGLVVSDLLQIHLLSKLIEPRAAIIAILMYRMVSSVIPWIISLIMILRRIYDNYNTDQHKKQFAFNILSIFTLIVGIILCLSVATPSILLRIKFLRRFVKKDVLVLARFITLTSGGLLILLSQGIKKSVKKSFYIAETVLLISVFSTLLKGLDIEESIITLILGIVMYIMKDGFTEKAIKFSTKYFANTIIKLSSVTVFFIFISNSVRKVNFFSSHRKYSLQYLIENKKFILLYVLFVLILSYLAQYTRTKKITFSKLTDEDFSKIDKFLDEYGGNEFSHLVYLNDKNVYFDKTNTVMIMYRPVQNSVIVLGDPIGKKENFVEAINDFIIYCNEYHMNVCFYEINGENLELYCDQGFRFVKVGQDATLNLNEFSLVGKKNRTWRHVINNFDKGNYEFKVEEATDNLLSQMKVVSDKWLGNKNEMGFSLGFFDEDYLKRTKIACIYKDNELLAFANLQPFYDNKTLSIDLMRYDRSNEDGLMDFIFIKLILWGQDNNFEKFYLGMAPLSKVGDKIYSKKKEKILNIVYNTQNKIYNFKGLRNYKDKFKPDWSNKYIAYTSDFNLPYILINVVNSKKK